MKDLEIPPEAAEGEEAYEMIRFWIVDGEDVVQMLVGAMGDEEPKAWGSILADIARHAINAMGQQNPALDAQTLRAQIEQGFRERMDQRIAVTGSLRGMRQ